MARFSSSTLSGALFVLLAPASARAQLPVAHLAITSMIELPVNGPEAGGGDFIAVIHRLVVTNHGPSAVTNARLVETYNFPLFGDLWTCSASPGSSCQGATANLLNEGTATFTIRVNLHPDVIPAPPAITARVQPPPDVDDPNPADNQRTLHIYRDAYYGNGRYHAATACRLVDTRVTQAPLRRGETRDFPVAGQACGIPGDATAAVLNVTVVNPTDSGTLSVYPLGRWTSTSTLNFATGRTRANLAVVPLGRQGFSVLSDMPPRSLGQVHLVVDVYGWFRRPPPD